MLSPITCLPVRAALVAIATVAAVACGPSSKEIKKALAASYQCPEAKVFKAVADTMNETLQPLTRVDTTQGIVASAPRWHTKAGARKRSGAAYVDQGDVAFALIATMERRGDGFGVAFQPVVMTHVPGSPAGQRIGPEHADWPMWAADRVDAVAVGIYERLKSCAQ